MLGRPRRGVLWLALATAACAAPPAPPPAARHLVLVTIDTLRADRLGCYGSRNVATPNLDRLASKGVMAVHATVHVPLTRPSHTSIFTGLLPAEHGIRDNVSPTLAPDVPTLAPMLKAAGFRTGAFVSSIVLSRQSGLNRGFDEYSDRFEIEGDDARFLNTIQRPGDAVMKEALAWIQSAGGGRFFAWIHLYDPHDPYEPPEPYASRYADRPYDGEVAWSDDLVGRLDAALEHLGLGGETLLVVTSDHGEGLGEHGEAVHGFFVYESTLHVPLLLRGPGIPPGGKLSANARSADLLPTLLDLLGLARPPGLRLSGRSLAPALRGGAEPPEEPAYAESLLPLLHYGWSDLRALRDGRWKYIQAPRPELYDLEADPGETRDLARQMPARAETLRNRLATLLAREREVKTDAAGVPADLLEKLGALGYLGAGAPRSAPGQAAADPKDKIAEYKVLNRLVREGLVALREKDYTASIQRFRELLARGVESFEVHYYLGRALAAAGKPREAIPHFEAALLRLPGFSAAYTELAQCRIALGDAPGAIEVLRRGQAAAPRDPRLHEREAQVWKRGRRPAQAAAAYRAAVALAPKDALLRVQLGEALRDTGALDDAARVLREAVDLDPAPASYWNALGMVLGAAGRLTEAEGAFREALGRDTANAQYAYNAGLAAERQGRAAEARSLYEEALRRDPSFVPARAGLRARSK
jgi:arylsulfatase A-like enzyme/Tfp pilus assembly protein PilF